METLEKVGVGRTATHGSWQPGPGRGSSNRSGTGRVRVFGAMVVQAIVFAQATALSSLALSSALSPRVAFCVFLALAAVQASALWPALWNALALLASSGVLSGGSARFISTGVAKLGPSSARALVARTAATGLAVSVCATPLAFASTVDDLLWADPEPVATSPADDLLWAEAQPSDAASSWEPMDTANFALEAVETVIPNSAEDGDGAHEATRTPLSGPSLQETVGDQADRDAPTWSRGEPAASHPKQTSTSGGADYRPLDAKGTEEANVESSGAASAVEVRAPKVPVYQSLLRRVSTEASGDSGAHASSASQQGPQVHVVAPGESLWAIAAAALPQASNAEIDEAWRGIYQANRDLIGADPDLIEVGTELELFL